MGLAAGSFAKASEQRLYGLPRRHFAAVMPPDAVRESEQPAVASHPGFRVGTDVADVVFIVVARSAGVGYLREVDI
jgi:hypothetical protein